MNLHQQQKQKAQSVYMSSIEWLANTAAVVVTFFALPIAHYHSLPWVTHFTAQYYGREFIEPVVMVWYVILAFLIYFAARASVSTLLIIGGITIAMRLL